MTQRTPRQTATAPAAWPWLAVPSALAFGLFSLLPWSYFRMVGWPWLLLWQGAGLGLMVAVLGRLRRWAWPWRPLGHGLDWVLAALGLVAVAAAVTSEFPALARWNLAVAGVYGVALYGYRNWVDRSVLTRQRLALGLGITAILVAGVSLAWWQPDPAMWRSASVITGLRNSQPLGHHNFVGGYLGLNLPLVAAVAQGRRGWQRWGLGLGAVGIALAIYVSGSRGAALGVVGWLAVVWLFKIWCSGHPWRWGLGGAIPAGLVLAGLATNPRLGVWWTALVHPGGPRLTDGPTLDRWFMAQLGANLLGQHPWLGVGPGVLGRVSNQYRVIAAGDGLSHTQQLHNTPLQIAAELGLVGAGLVVVLLALMLRLGWRLHRCNLVPADRALLGGIGGGAVVYGLSGLTDYQLENIPIAGTLVGLAVLLLALGDRYGLASVPWSEGRRRWASLGLGGWLGFTVAVWVPFALTVGLTWGGIHSFERGNIALAHSQWQRAARLSPWDPTPSAIATDHLYALVNQLGSSVVRERTQAHLLTFAQQAQSAAPNDVWFNQNLAVLLSPSRPDLALAYAQRAVQLLPRHGNYGYWLVGTLLLAQGQRSQAVTAFTLEGLVHPAVLLSPLWQDDELAPLYPTVVAAVEAELDGLLARVKPSHPGYASLCETRWLLGWWRGGAGGAACDLSPRLGALAVAGEDPALALERLAGPLKKGDPRAQLLARWLDPQGDRPPLAQLATAVDVAPERLRTSLARRDLRLWLRSIVGEPPSGRRIGVGLLYRHQVAQRVSLMLRPEGIRQYVLIDRLELVRPWPREFLALDEAIERLKAESLGLPHPSGGRGG